MDSWHNHLTNMIALHSRGKHIEETRLRLGSITSDSLSASTVIEKMIAAEEVKKLYLKAHRMCKLLAETQPDSSKVNLSHMCSKIEGSLSRIDDILAILDSKARKWGLSNDDLAPTTTRMEPMPETMRADISSAEDANIDSDVLRDEIKDALKSLIDVVDYMETSTLLDIRKQLNKLLG